LWKESKENKKIKKVKTKKKEKERLLNEKAKSKTQNS